MGNGVYDLRILSDHTLCAHEGDPITVLKFSTVYSSNTGERNAGNLVHVSVLDTGPAVETDSQVRRLLSRAERTS